jgi:SAM-dependent methyltransferase
MTTSDEERWDARYAASTAVWSGEPNPRLVEEAAGLAPGTALDAGCGEGADAMWLAERGWTVTAVDLSRVALARAQATAQPAATGKRITWLHADLVQSPPAPACFDLVSAHFMQFAPEPRAAFVRGLAAAVKPGGTLLIVGHHPSDLATTVRRPPFPERLSTAEDVAQLLDPAAWTIVVAAARPRDAIDPAGRTVTVHDAVLRAQRTPRANA